MERTKSPEQTHMLESMLVEVRALRAESTEEMRAENRAMREEYSAMLEEYWQRQVHRRERCVVRPVTPRRRRQNSCKQATMKRATPRRRRCSGGAQERVAAHAAQQVAPGDERGEVVRRLRRRVPPEQRGETPIDDHDKTTPDHPEPTGERLRQLGGQQQRCRWRLPECKTMMT